METALGVFVEANLGLLDTKQPLTSGGGSLDENETLPIAELTNASGMCLGTVVFVHCLWAVTTAHCVRKEQTRLFVLKNRAGARRIEVESIHWQNGETVNVSEGQPWPTDIGEMEDAFDQTAVLKLKEPIYFVNGYADLRNSNYPKIRDGLLMGGLGQNDEGNYEAYPRIWSMHFFGPSEYWRGAAYFDPSDPIGGYPKEGDSGSPVFYLQLFPWNFGVRVVVSLLGTHRARVCAGSNPLGIPETSDIAEFIPLSAGTLGWIRTLVATSPATKMAAMSAFNFRGLFNCLTLESNGAGLDGDKWVLNGVSGEKSFLEPCDTVTIDLTTRTMKIYRCNHPAKPATEIDDLAPMSLTGDGTIHCLKGTDGGTKPNSYYVFLRSPGRTPPDAGQVAGDPCRRIMIEVYVAGSAHTPPNGKNVGNPLYEDIENEVACTCRSIARFPVHSGGDQDDQGNGYERH